MTKPVHNDFRETSKKEELYSYLNRAAAELAKTRDTPGALDQISRFIVPKFANWFSIDQLKDDRLELLLLKHEDPEKIRKALEYRAHYPTDLNSNAGNALVIKTGKPSFVPVITEAMISAAITDPVQLKAILEIGIQSIITVAMSSKDEINGLVTFVSSTPGNHFDEADLDFAQNFANLIGLALENTRLNEAAEATAKQFHFLTDAIPHKLWTSAPNGRATYYNQGWYDYTGEDNFETLREKIWDLMHPADRAVATVKWPEAIARGEAMEMEHRFRRHDGVYRWHLSRFSPHRDDAGQIVLWVGTSTDIHEQQSAAIELAATNEELAALNEEQMATNEELTDTQRTLNKMVEELGTAYEQIRLSKDAAQLGTFDMDLTKGTMEWDKRCRTLFGISHSEAVTYDKDFANGLHPDDRERILRVIEKSMSKSQSNGDYDVEYRTVGQEDGQVRWVRAKGKVYFDENAEPVRFIGSVLDITDQKLEAARLNENAERQTRLAAIVDASDDSILSKTLDGIITSWNRAAEKMFGYAEAEVIGKHISLIIPVERLGEEEFIISHIKTGNSLDHFETVRVTKDGRNIPISMSVSPIIDAGGNIVGASKIARDISAQLEAQETAARLYRQVKALNDKKDEFIGLASHELKTPLTSVSGYLQILSKIKTDDSSRRFVDKALEQVKKLTALVNDLLDVSKIEAGKLQLNIVEFDMVDLVRDAVELIQHSNSKYVIGLESGVRTRLVKADRQRIEQVLINLLTNSIKYSPGTNKVDVLVNETDSEVRIGVRDHGLGIAEEKLSAIFDRFYRVDDADPNISGLGIGLYISQEIIGRHNGKIWAESELRKGSTFWFTLPL